VPDEAIVTTEAYLQRADLFVGAALVDVLESEALPAAGVDAEHFWQGLS
jgi:hypothetical protein